jgi:WD repeat-containing protein 35
MLIFGSVLPALRRYDGAEGYSDPNAPTMALFYENGRIQIMRHDTDDNPVLIDCGMSVRKAKWNTNGTVLAVAGSKVGTLTTTGTADAKDAQIVQFYSPWGKVGSTLTRVHTQIVDTGWLEISS